MLLANSNIRIVSKIIEDKYGVPYLAYFAVAEFEGQIYVKLVRTAPINASQGLKNEPERALLCCDSIVSPYVFTFNFARDKVFNKECVFIVSQPTRAPNFK